ncbi:MULTISPECIES: 16S rRNA (uracil(1498)-N(3))-methyltransferase [unclassified Modestobacter]|uniref:16S rRNA (uracil(1498)-N(3))-methyltransferase n=1 Tax=unclassified Modestobacter TaxID=2643866 RepID=UPI0022AA20F7|nr:MULTISPECIES: 16S rRNA (uracil(1498)-N(3))-methyltransferase [unclassified Modestobacter]MCZ2824569.1 16S rRNA (uracil(1498)-N(3))-methyltransferase [Modestobacter sp. VKM Ac-2981]MCZ2853903.1 16S rRNA (uracil(1498)-N(3))-methyltransferase [Modestobacter sp. VKM Ac-2982]
MSQAPDALSADGAPLFLLDAVPPGDVLTVDGAEGRHAVDVLRLGAGERVRVSDGQGLLVEGSVLAAEGSALRVQVLARHEVPAPQPEFVLVQALPKGDRGPLAVDLATELGVDRIVPWTAARCVTRWREDRVDKGLAKWRSAARAATKQARRPRVPEVTEPMSTRQVCGMLAEVDLALVLHEQARQPFAQVEVPTTGTIAVIVGPEGGLTDGEVVAFRAAGAHSVRLGAEVLRTSTAGAAALAALSVRTRWA